MEILTRRHIAGPTRKDTPRLGRRRRHGDGAALRVPAAGGGDHAARAGSEAVRIVVRPLPDQSGILPMRVNERVGCAAGGQHGRGSVGVERIAGTPRADTVRDRDRPRRRGAEETVARLKTVGHPVGRRDCSIVARRTGDGKGIGVADAEQFDLAVADIGIFLRTERDPHLRHVRRQDSVRRSEPGDPFTGAWIVVERRSGYSHERIRTGQRLAGDLRDRDPVPSRVLPPGKEMDRRQMVASVSQRIDDHGVVVESIDFGRARDKSCIGQLGWRAAVAIHHGKRRLPAYQVVGRRLERVAVRRGIARRASIEE